jgi:hypothetical protein
VGRPQPNKRSGEGDNRESVRKRTDKQSEGAYYKLAGRTKPQSRCFTSTVNKGPL